MSDPKVDEITDKGATKSTERISPDVAALPIPEPLVETSRDTQTTMTTELKRISTTNEQRHQQLLQRVSETKTAATETLRRWRAMKDTASCSSSSKSDAVCRVSIVGTAGRLNVERDMSLDVFNAMVASATEQLPRMTGLPSSCIHLVSGGAAWADHVAVTLFLWGGFAGLTLHMPCAWRRDTVCFEDNHSCESSRNPGRFANMYHARFETKTGIHSLRQIQESVERGAVLVESYRGFHDRNSAVASSPFLLAFSWDRGDKPESSFGTYDTWKKCKGVRVHVSLRHLMEESLELPRDELSLCIKELRTYLDPRDIDSIREPKNVKSVSLLLQFEDYAPFAFYWLKRYLKCALPELARYVDDDKCRDPATMTEKD